MSPSGYYLDPELSLEEQREMLEGFYEEIRSELMRPGRQGWPQPCPHKGLAQVSAAKTSSLGHMWVTSTLPQGTVPGESQALASVTCCPRWEWGLYHIPEIPVFA